MDVVFWGFFVVFFVTIPLPDQTVSTNAAYTWQITEKSITDIDQTDVLTYWSTLADGSDLPAWLTFDASTRTFSGRVPMDATGYLDIEVQVNDGSIRPEAAAAQTASMIISEG